MDKFNKYTFVWGLLIVALFSLLTIFGFIYKNKTGNYKRLEDKIIEAEKRYVDEKFLYPQDEKKVVITVKELIEAGYLDNLDIENDNCEGYAEVYKVNSVFEYKGFIKCNKYQTKGYEKSIEMGNLNE